MTKDNSSDSKKASLVSQNLNLEQSGQAEVEISGEVPAEVLDQHRSEVLREKKKDLEIDGFRKGQVPEEMAEKHFGEDNLLRAAAEKILQAEYPRLIEHFELEPVGQPQVSITKLTSGNPMTFKIQTALMPKFELPDYHRIITEKQPAKDEIPQSVTIEEKEVDAVVEQLEKQLTQQQSSETEETQTDSGLVDAEGQPLSGQAETQPIKITDENVNQLGDFQTVDDLRAQITDNIKREKENQAIEKNRLNVLEAVLEQTEISVPEIVLEEELNRMINQMKTDIKQAGMEYDKYLQQLGKSETELRDEWKPQAEKRVKIQLLLNRIAEEEKIEPDQTILDQQTKTILDQHPQAEPEQVKTYVASQLKNEAIFKMLDGRFESSKSADDTQSPTGPAEEETPSTEEK